MKTKTLAELVAEVKDAYQGVLRRALDARHRMDAALASLEAALARPPAVEGAVGRLVEHLNANADDFNRWPMEMKSLIAAVEAERAGERVVTFHGRSEDDVHSFTAGGCRNGLNEIAISLVFGTQPPEGSRWAIRRLPDPPKTFVRTGPDLGSTPAMDAAMEHYTEQQRLRHIRFEAAAEKMVERKVFNILGRVGALIEQQSGRSAQNLESSPVIAERMRCVELMAQSLQGAAIAGTWKPERPSGAVAAGEV